MATEEGVKERTLAETSTWAVAAVCFVLLFISIAIERILHAVGHVSYFQENHHYISTFDVNYMLKPLLFVPVSATSNCSG